MDKERIGQATNLISAVQLKSCDGNVIPRLTWKLSFMALSEHQKKAAFNQKLRGCVDADIVGRRRWQQCRISLWWLRRLSSPAVSWKSLDRGLAGVRDCIPRHLRGSQHKSASDEPGAECPVHAEGERSELRGDVFLVCVEPASHLGNQSTQTWYVIVLLATVLFALLRHLCRNTPGLLCLRRICPSVHAYVLAQPEAFFAFYAVVF